MTPVPKGLSKAQVLRWRRMVSMGVRSTVATSYTRERRRLPGGTTQGTTLPFALPGTL